MGFADAGLVTATCLGPDQGLVRPPQHLVVVVIKRIAHAQAAGPSQLLKGIVLDLDHDRKTGANPACQALRPLEARIRKQHAKFVAAQPRNKVSAPHTLLDQLRKLVYDLITDLVTVDIVDFLEVVDVDQQQGDRCPGAWIAKAGVQPVLLRTAIADVAQMISKSKFEQPVPFTAHGL